MSHSRGPAPGFEKYPEHRIEIRPAGRRWQARLGSHVLADSDRAMLLDESRYPRAVYFPPEDVAEDELTATESKSICPFKGEASYFRSAADADGDDIAWTYPETFDEVADIAGFVAFYTDKVAVADSTDERG